MSNRRIELLQNMPIFGGLAVSTLELILELSRPAVVAQGDFFFRQGDSGTSTFVLESGRVAILRSHQGRDHLLRHLGPGDCFGEVALIDFGPRSTSVRAEAEATTLELQASNLLKIAKHDLEQYAIIYMNMARELARRLRAADDRLFAAEFAPHRSAGDTRHG